MPISILVPHLASSVELKAWRRFQKPFVGLDCCTQTVGSDSRTAVTVPETWRTSRNEQFRAGYSVPRLIAECRVAGQFVKLVAASNFFGPLRVLQRTPMTHLELSVDVRSSGRFEVSARLTATQTPSSCESLFHGSLVRQVHM